MQISPYGLVFNDEFELTYNLLSAIGIEVRRDGSLFDTDTHTIIHFNGKMMKANIDPHHIIYAGQGEGIFEPLTNVRQVTTMLGYFIDKKQNLEDMEFSSYFPAEIEHPVTGWKFSNLTMKCGAHNQIATAYYYNKCLKFIEMIFLLDDQQVNLLNFDSTENAPVKNKRRKRPSEPTRPRKRSPITFEE